jgi:oligosaccharide repeat unit polymerase
MLFTISPQKIFTVVWLIPLAMPYLIVDNLTLKRVGTETIFLVLSNIFMMYIFYFIFWLYGMRGSVIKVHFALKKLNFEKFSRNIDKIFWVWIVVYAINIIGSGGIPLIWIIQGDPRTYSDFGLPTLGGLGNMLRAFLLSSYYIIYFYSNLAIRKRRKYSIISIFLIITPFLFETSRGNGLVLILHPIALYFLLNDFKTTQIFKGIFAFFIITFILGGVQALRYSDGIYQLLKFAENSGFSNSSIIEALLIPAIIYSSVPIINLDLNIQTSELIKFQPFYSLTGFLPTVIRDIILVKGDYGELINEANNASSFFIPFIRDFGIIGTYISVSIISAVVAYCYSRSRTGNLIYMFSYPPIFMSVFLSFFSLFFNSLVVLLYPLVVVWSLKDCILLDK